ncbi:hypothetical protein RHMOL_Rhmol07G0202600 [Rhododendron molle]|uniref:Uncharacterized protein n=1 Tax=Rhododendron molle TaxID=49168 RepID=A0ACC0N3X0_RHOML|nr:hypothetical protein RHMOL_Rhmol07G0202600 [Rhododendron molle]
MADQSGDSGEGVTDGGDGGGDQQHEAGSSDEGRVRESDPRATDTTGAMGPGTKPLGTGTAAGDSEQTRGGSGGDASEDDRRATEPDARATEQAGAVGSSSGPEDSGMVAEGPPMVERGSGGAEGSRAVGDDIEPSQTPLRDSAKGKWAVIEEEHVDEVRMEKEQTTEAAPVEIREEDIAFRPPASAARSSRHVPITYADIAEHAPDEILARVLENHPEIGEYVLKAKEDRAKAIEAAEAVARAEREAGRERAGPEGLAADMEAEERDAEEAQGPRATTTD